MAKNIFILSRNRFSIVYVLISLFNSALYSGTSNNLVEADEVDMISQDLAAYSSGDMTVSYISIPPSLRKYTTSGANYVDDGGNYIAKLAYEPIVNSQNKVANVLSGYFRFSENVYNICRNVYLLFISTIELSVGSFFPSEKDILEYLMDIKNAVKMASVLKNYINVSSCTFGNFMDICLSVSIIVNTFNDLGRVLGGNPAIYNLGAMLPGLFSAQLYLLQTGAVFSIISNINSICTSCSNLIGMIKNIF